MEAPIAAALGRLDGLNLFDPYWMDPEYDLWYRLLDCGLKLPASTGSDWYLCSSNRVYVDVGETFSYSTWLAGLRAGRTFVTDGPVLKLTVAGHGPSNQVLDVGMATRSVPVSVEWEHSAPIDRVDVVRDGEVVARFDNTDGAMSGTFNLDVDTADATWIAARCWGARRNSYGHAQWAHTSPVYLRTNSYSATTRASADFFVEQIDKARSWLSYTARFDNFQQRDRMLDLFDEGRAWYARLAKG
jgi:hypothetical protein